MIPRSRTYLEQILVSISRIESYASGGADVFFESTLLQDGIVHNLELIGASVKELPADMLDAFPNIPWSSIARMRDYLAHHYLNVDLEIVWEVVRQDLPPLKDAVEDVLRSISPSE